MIHIYYKKLKEDDRLIKYDRLLINFIKKIFKLNRTGGLDKVFINLLKGFDLLKIKYSVNTKFSKIRPTDAIIVLGIGKNVLLGYNLNNKIIAGIGLMTYPTEWLNMKSEYPIVKYLQHSKWANEIYKPYFNEICDIWPVGIDTYEWTPKLNKTTETKQILIYNKIRYNKEKVFSELLNPIKDFLKLKNYSFVELVYGFYTESEYKELLNNSSCMIYFSEHESQGLAYQECLSCDVPILAWDKGVLVDPNYDKLNLSASDVSSVPYFDETCGVKFTDYSDFEINFGVFIDNLQNYKPREYVLNNLSLEKSTFRMMEIVNATYPNYEYN